MLCAKGMADFAPSIKQSYGLIFFIKANKRIIKNKTGMTYFIKNQSFFIKTLTNKTPIREESKVAKMVGRIMSDEDAEP